MAAEIRLTSTLMTPESNEGQGRCFESMHFFYFFNKKWNYEHDWTINIMKSDLFDAEILIQQIHDKETASRYLFI